MRHTAVAKRVLTPALILLTLAACTSAKASAAPTTTEAPTTTAAPTTTTTAPRLLVAIPEKLLELNLGAQSACLTEGQQSEQIYNSGRLTVTCAMVDGALAWTFALDAPLPRDEQVAGMQCAGHIADLALTGKDACQDFLDLLSLDNSPAAQYVASQTKNGIFLLVYPQVSGAKPDVDASVAMLTAVTDLIKSYVRA